MVIIRLIRQGKKKIPFYQIVVSDNRFPCYGRFIEKIGFFYPLNNNKENFKINMFRLNFWIKNGAKISKRIYHLLKIYKNKNNVIY
ncbi:30S ribosomal protein S16 [Candidatus Annandia adelgestsuga]|uniref:Small ribosomal subunit protein bS16 n=1 Tax=Candidatus Annandia adelgestsuga TaxID=1302411 RepID=A0A3Q9CLZ5_9ENTR|nr:30S ribosomal protein S16 [Candidatus Annandia adelgestsuga]AZP36150.1 30S ribosomal protein S16 [Candidatus Annandia adelgestsuga]